MGVGVSVSGRTRRGAVSEWRGLEGFCVSGGISVYVCLCISVPVYASVSVSIKYFITSLNMIYYKFLPFHKTLK